MELTERSYALMIHTIKAVDIPSDLPHIHIFSLHSEISFPPPKTALYDLIPNNNRLN